MNKTLFEISKMDCPSEESLIRSKLQRFSEIQQLEFDMPNRKLTVYHIGQFSAIDSALLELNLGSKRVHTEETDKQDFSVQVAQRHTLWIVLLINLAFFIIELATGLISRSMGLVADSLDMLADSFVYGISLLAVGGTITRKKKIATLAGYFQIFLAIIGFLEVIRRFIGIETMPDYSIMIYVSILALVGNSICLYLLQKQKSDEAHMRASMIFTSNDVIINLGVIAAGLLVLWLKTNIPDLIIGSIVFLMVTQGAMRILKLGK